MDITTSASRFVGIKRPRDENFHHKKNPTDKKSNNDRGKDHKAENFVFRNDNRFSDSLPHAQSITIILQSTTIKYEDQDKCEDQDNGYGWFDNVEELDN